MTIDIVAIEKLRKINTADGYRLSYGTCFERERVRI